MAKSSGIRANTRKILRKSPRDRGVPSVGATMRSFPAGSRVAVKIEPAIHGGMPHRRFQGETGTIVGPQGSSFVVAVTSGQKAKTLVVRPEHLKLLDA